jgi:hypothetical protein
MSRFTLYQNLNRIFISVFLLFLVLQFLFWLNSESVKPNVYIVPPVPSEKSIEALSLGDKEFYFRLLGLRIENAGDSFGRFTALRNYDYSKLYQWFKLLDTLDDRSIYIPALASNYYSQTQNHEDTRYIIQYLDEYASKDIDKYWWWMFQAFIIANSTLHDYPLALKLAYKLSENNNEQAPHWTKEMPAFVHSKMGDDCAAYLFISKILNENEKSEKKIKAEDMDFMRHYISYILSDLKQKNFNVNQCK